MMITRDAVASSRFSDVGESRPLTYSLFLANLGHANSQDIKNEDISASEFDTTLFRTMKRLLIRLRGKARI